VVRTEGILDGLLLSPRENPRYFPGRVGCTLAFLNQTRVLLDDNDHAVLEAEIALLSRCFDVGDSGGWCGIGVESSQPSS